MEKEKILIIDDEESVRDLLSDILTAEGYSVKTARDGEEGYQEAHYNDYDLIIIDINLPGDDGITITQHIRHNDPDAMVIAITGCASLENLQAAISAGVFDYISKPFDVKQVIFAVHRALAAGHLINTNKRLMRELSNQNEALEEKILERTRKLHEAYKKLEEVYLHIITTLISTVEAKDSYTRHHSENVAKYSKKIAEEMGLSEQEIENVHRAACLHDIGKIGIHDAVLNKPGKLTSAEFEEIKKHPVTGKDILEPLGFLNTSIDIIKQHHERYNGTGYPGSLIGDEICIGARILAVADTYDAMISARPYRKKTFTKKEIINEIERYSGIQFDPKVVNAFLRIVDSF